MDTIRDEHGVLASRKISSSLFANQISPEMSASRKFCRSHRSFACPDAGAFFATNPSAEFASNYLVNERVGLWTSIER